MRGEADLRGAGGSTPAASLSVWHGPTLVELLGTPPVGHLLPLAHAFKCLQDKKTKQHIASSRRDLLCEGMQMLTHALPQGGDIHLGKRVSNRQ